MDGQLAFDCLNSVPLTEDDAVRLVRSIQPFLEFQTSELAWLSCLRTDSYLQTTKRLTNTVTSNGLPP